MVSTFCELEAFKAVAIHVSVHLIASEARISSVVNPRKGSSRSTLSTLLSEKIEYNVYGHDSKNDSR